MANITPFKELPEGYDFRKILTGCVLVGLIARLAVAFGLGLTWQTPDTLDYLDMGNKILLGSPRSYFPNGYPLLIAGIQFITGEAALVPALRVINVFASAAVVLCVGLIGKNLAGEYAGALSALGTALFPNQVNYARYLLTEPLTALLLSAGILLLLVSRRAWSGAAFYAAALFRTTYAPVLLIVPAILLVSRQSLKQVAIFICGAACVGLFYGALIVADVAEPSANLNINYLFAINTMSHKSVDWSIQREFSEEERENALRHYIEFAFEHPGKFTAQRLSSLWNMWGPMAPLGTEEHRRSLRSSLLIGLRFPVLLLAMWGLFRKRNNYNYWLVAAPAIVATLVHMMFFSLHRHSVPVEPLAIVLASIGLVELLSIIRDRFRINN